MQTNAVSVDVETAAKTYPDGTQGLKPTSLSIAPAEVMALLGPSGCGKTTLLRIIAGLETVDSGGSIRFGERDVTSLPVEKRQVGMVFQHYALFPHLSIAANIGYGLKVRGVEKMRQRQIVGDLLDLVRLQEHAHKRPTELSGGQRQRVALARAVAAEPKVLLLDEPLTALDAKLKESLRDELAQLLRRLSITAVYVTHDQQEAMAIADRMAVMQSGQIVQLGRPEALYRQPSHAFVAAFLGRINQLTRTSEQTAHGVLSFDTFTLPVPTSLGSKLMLRPEHISVQPPHLPGAPGIVATRTFLGEKVQLKVSLPNQPHVLVDCHGDVPWQADDLVSVVIDPKNLLPFGDSL
ncbi:MAG: ABC transporter ATP-binding protein [Orrella sp.]